MFGLGIMESNTELPGLGPHVCMGFFFSSYTLRYLFRPYPVDGGGGAGFNRDFPLPADCRTRNTQV